MKRFSFGPGGEDYAGGMDENEEGEYVKWSDAQTEIAILQAVIQREVALRQKAESRLPEAAIDTFQGRILGLEGFVGEEPKREQKHLIVGSPERVYWHYGYLMALKDVVAKLGGPQ